MARFPFTKTLKEYDFRLIPSLNKAKVLGMCARVIYRQKGNGQYQSGTAAPGKPTSQLPWGCVPCARVTKCGSPPSPVLLTSF